MKVTPSFADLSLMNFISMGLNFKRLHTYFEQYYQKKHRFNFEYHFLCFIYTSDKIDYLTGTILCFD